MVARIRSLWRAVTRRSSFEREMDEELRFHLDQRTDDLVRGGLTRAQAERRARIELGNPEAWQDRCRESRGLGWIDALAIDLRYGWRTIRKQALLSATIVATLAIGIGANTAMFSVLHSILAPVAYPDADRLAILLCRVTLPDHRTPTMGWSYPKLQDLLPSLTAFESVAAAGALDVNLTSPGDAERIRGEIVSGNYFSTLGVRARLGSLRLSDERSRAASVVLSESLWQRRFGGQDAILGATIELNRTPFTVIGVAPASFIGETGRADMWVPLAATPLVLSNPTRLQQRMAHWLTVVGRLGPGVTMAGADENLKLAARRMEAAAPSAPPPMIWDGTVTPLLEAKIDPAVRKALSILVAAVACVLLIACLNLASVLMNRAVARRREVAIRLAIGAGRGTIVRQFVTESLILAAIGGGLGFVAAAWTLQALNALGFQVPAAPGAPFVRSVDLTLARLDSPAVVAYGALITTVATLLFGILPAVQASTLRILEALKGSGAGWLDGRRSGGAPALRRGLLVGQVALAVVLLASAGLMVRTFDRLLATDIGIDPEGVLTFRLDLPPSAYSPELAARFLERLTDSLQQLPGVRGASAVNGLPLQGQTERTEASIGGVVLSPETGIHMVDAAYFAALRIPLVRGRLLTDEDRASSARVAVISETAARRYAGSGEPLGRRISLGLNGWSGAGDAEIVGIVGDVKYQLLTMPFGSEVYLSYRQRAPARAFVLLHTDLAPAALIPAVRARVAALDRTLPVYAVRPMTDIVSSASAGPRFTSVLLGVFSGAALLLACVGLYGALAYSVSARTREIGVRMALGAEPRAVRRFVSREIAAVTAAGLVLGLAGAQFAGRFVSGLLYQVEPADPVTLVAVSIVIAAAACLAGYVPARRASRVSPLVALREE
jgi:putative ABC transport system permease protein